MAGEAPAIQACALVTIKRDPLLEQMMAEEREREEAAAGGRANGGELAGGSACAHHDASGFKGAGGRAGARDARKLDKLRERK